MAIAWLTLVACGPGSGSSDGGALPDGPGICCPIEITPTTPCGCWGIGGYARTLAECPRHCDGAGYSERTDEHGCTVLVHYGLRSCLPVPDAGHEPEDAGVLDAAADANLPDDAGDASVPDDAGAAGDDTGPS